MVGTRPAKVRPATHLGQVFIEARTQFGLSLEMAAQQLKIPVNQLAALERGDFSVFSAEVYARGACLKYAHYLQLDLVRLEPAVLRELSGARQRVPLTLLRPLSWVQALLTPRLLLLLIGTAAAAMIGLYILWQVQSFLRLPQLAVQEPAQAIVNQTDIQVRGVARDASQVVVNGEAVLLAADGSFALPLQLHPGINVLQIKATNAAGRQRIIERTLLAPRE